MSESMPGSSEPEQQAERLATVSSCCGFLGEVTLTDSAVIILFAAMLGAGDMLSLITTSVLPLLNGICVIPMAFLAMKTGPRRLIFRACAFASIAYFFAIAAPWFGKWSVAVLMGAILFFAFSLTGFIAGWFPLVDSFLLKERRTLFFSRMRFSHQLTATVFLFAVGLVIGKSPPVWVLQTVLAVAGLVFIGRAVAISRIPVFPPRRTESLSFREGLVKAFENRPLSGFSLYLFLLYLAGYGTVPLVLLALKKQWNAPDNIVVLVSACALFGMLLGYLCVNRLLQIIGLRWAFLLLHGMFLTGNLLLFLIHGSSLLVYGIIALLLMMYSFGIAASSILASAEMLKLVSRGNKIMAMAFSSAFSSGGMGLSRFLSSLLLGCGIFASEWSIGTMKICRYQSLLLVYTVALLFAGFFLLLVPAVLKNK